MKIFCFCVMTTVLTAGLITQPVLKSEANAAHLAKQHAGGNKGAAVNRASPAAATTASSIEQTGGGKGLAANRQVLAGSRGQHNPGKPAGSAIKPPTKRIQSPQPIKDLLDDYPFAVSIEIRISKDKDYTDAVSFYTAQFRTEGITSSITNGYSVSWAYPKVNPTTEFLVVNTSKIPALLPALKATDIVIGYVSWDSIKTKAAMVTAYTCALATGADTSLEEPGKGTVGGRDTSKGTVRAVLHRKEKKGHPLVKKDDSDYGVIINPPVP